MTGNFEVNDQDIQDLIFCINYILQRRPPIKVSQLRRIEDLKERLLKVEVNQF